MDPLIDPWSCDGSQPSGGRLRWEHLLPIKSVSQPDGHDIYLEETMHVDPRLFRDVERVEPAGGGLKVPGFFAPFVSVYRQDASGALQSRVSPYHVAP